MPTTDAPRLQPHDLNAERLLLGSCMLDSRILEEAANQLEPEDFYDSRHARTFRTMLSLARQGQPADPVAIGEWLKRHHQDWPEKFADLHTWWSEVIRPAHARPAIQKIAELAVRRRLIHQAQTWIDRAYDPDTNAEALLGEVLRTLSQHRAQDFGGVL